MEKNSTYTIPLVPHVLYKATDKKGFQIHIAQNTGSAFHQTFILKLCLSAELLMKATLSSFLVAS